MYRVIAILSGVLVLSACSSMPDFMKPAPIMDTVRFESQPPGAEAKTSNGQTCQTPCALALPVDAPLAVTFTLNGYHPETENIEPISVTGSPTQLRPNPVVAELTPAPPPPKLVKKPERKRKSSATSAAKSAAKLAAKRARPKPAAATTPAPAPITAAPAQQQAPAPSEPSAPPPQR